MHLVKKTPSLAVVFFLSVSPLAARADLEPGKLERSFYEIEMSLDDITRGELEGLLKMDLVIDVNGPATAEILRGTTVDPDVGGAPIDWRLLRLSGGEVPIVRSFGSLSRMASGKAVEGTLRTFVNAIPFEDLDMPEEAVGPREVTVRPSFEGFSRPERPALKLLDAAGKPYFFTFHFERRLSFLLPGAGLGPFSSSLSPRSSARLLARASVVPARPGAPQYSFMDDLFPVPPGPRPTEGPCERPGSRRSLPPLALEDGGSVDRIEYCYPSKLRRGGFERLVLPIRGMRFPSLFSEGLERALAGGGIAKRPLLPVSDPSKMNCHGYAVRATTEEEALGLPREARWLDGPCPGCGPSVGTRGTYSLLVLLEQKYERVTGFASDNPFGDASLEGADKNLRQAIQDGRISYGDVALFEDQAGAFLHSGVIIGGPAQGDGIWLESKFEAGPVIDSPFLSVANVYRPSKVEVFRPRYPRRAPFNGLSPNTTKTAYPHG